MKINKIFKMFVSTNLLQKIKDRNKKFFDESPPRKIQEAEAFYPNIEKLRERKEKLLIALKRIDVSTPSKGGPFPREQLYKILWKNSDDFNKIVEDYREFWDEDFFIKVIPFKKLEWVVYLKENGCLFDKRACSSAALNCDLPILKYLREQGCPWEDSPDDYLTLRNAIAGGKIEVLEYLKENNYPMNKSDFSFLSLASWAGNLPVVDWLGRNGFSCDSPLAYAAGISSGKICILEWLNNHGCPRDGRECSWAAEKGEFEVLIWLKEKGFFCGKLTTHYAAMTSNFEMLHWLLREGAPLDKWTKMFLQSLIWVDEDMKSIGFDFLEMFGFDEKDMDLLKQGEIPDTLERYTDFFTRDVYNLLETEAKEDHFDLRESAWNFAFIENKSEA